MKIIRKVIRTGVHVAAYVPIRLGLLTPTKAKNVDGGRWHPTTRRHIELISFIQEANIASDSRILDVGCGYGALAQRLRTCGFTHIDGCDWKDDCAGIDTHTAVDLNAEGLRAYPDASYEVVIASDVLEHLENPAHMLRELRRVVAREGHVFISLPNCANLLERLVFLWTGNSTRYRSERHSPPHSHISMIPSNVLESLTDRASLRVVNRRGAYAYFFGCFIGSGRSPLTSYNLLYHFVPK